MENIANKYHISKDKDRFAQFNYKVDYIGFFKEKTQ